MRPDRVREKCTLFSSQVRSHDESTILVESGGFDPIHSFFTEIAAAEENHKREPARKRRKLNHQPTTRVNEVNQDELIVLSDVVIDFSFPGVTGVEGIDGDADPQGTGMPVAIVNIETNENGTQLRLHACRHHGSILILDSSPLAQPVLDQLNCYVGVHASGAQGVSVLDCTLIRSRNTGPTRIRLHMSYKRRSGVSAFVSGSRNASQLRNHSHQTLLRLYPESSTANTPEISTWTPRDFYESMQTGTGVQSAPADTFKGLLDSELYPFQKRAVLWMLAREGMKYQDRRVCPLSPAEAEQQCLALYKAESDADGQRCYVNHLQSIISRNEPAEQKVATSGGLLAEEMGLGKTVEFTALMTLHRRPAAMLETATSDPKDGRALLPGTATLIVTPASIITQWLTELRRHAPSLRVYRYQGIRSSDMHKSSQKSHDDLTKELANDYDVVLTTYTDLAREIYYADDPPERNMRHARRYERRRSALVEVEWWRVCLDESQMAENSESNPARVACRLPRIHSWAISGTPLRKDVEALQGLLTFLRCQPFCDNSLLWTHLMTSQRHLFRSLFNLIALRHTKAQIRDELHLPPQKRVVVTVPFSVVEQQNYANLFATMCEEVGVHADGAPRHGDWDPNDAATIEKMRSWLVRLRQACLHPQVGAKNRKALGRGQGPLRTVSEVLEMMINSNEGTLRLESRLLILAGLRHAHVLGNDKSNEHRSERALKIYSRLLQMVEDSTKAARQRLEIARTEQRARGEGADVQSADIDASEQSQETDQLLAPLQNSLRMELELQHACAFFAATSYYQIKINENLTTPESEQFKELEEQETTLYERAKTLRKEILSQTSSKADVLMKIVRQRKDGGDFIKMPTIPDLPLRGGIQSRRIIEKSDLLFKVMREQTDVIVAWRTKMAELLMQPLTDEDDEEITGEEYESSTKQQEELFVYYDALKTVQADLNTFITGELAPLIDHEAKYLMNHANSFLDPEVLEKPFVHAPALVLELFEVRARLREQVDDVGSLRGLIQEARLIEGSLLGGQDAPRESAERAIVKEQLASLQRIFREYSKVITVLEKETALFRSLQNLRVDFYRHLQELSDAVAPYKEELDETLDQTALESALQRKQKHEANVAQLTTKQRFLQHLRDESTEQSEARICVICRTAFERGVLTVCGHQYCKECIQAWFTQARTCPICKRTLSKYELHDITYKPQDLRAQEEIAQSDQSPTSSRSRSPNSQNNDSSPSTSSSNPSSAPTSIYATVDAQVMDSIQSIDLPASYGTKIDTLGRHLLYIRAHDSGAKSIVFSQYRDFLDVLGQAFREFRVRFARLGRAGAVDKFRHDPSIDCLLLDAKTDSSGLTLVNATHVFICEPLIQTAVELQAIARVHRIGQTRPTTVWMYLIRDTVEEAIYRISVKRRWAHAQSHSKDAPSKESSVSLPSNVDDSSLSASGEAQDLAIDAADSAALQASSTTHLLAAGKSTGEMVAANDLWQCLFGTADGAQ